MSKVRIYLGEVPTTRKIQKLVLTGEEVIYIYSGSASRIGFYTILSDMMSNARSNGFCTHFIPQITPNGSAINGVTFGAGNKYVFFTFSVDTATELNLTDLDSIKAYLAQQYAAGTPVTVWYVLAEPETGIVNEPLRKIGDYADEVSGITIPTIAGANTLSVGTTLQPSEVSVTYKGWHPVQNVHEKSKNLFDKSKRTDNNRVTYTTGEIGALSGVFVSDFTPIEPNTTYTLNIVSSISGKTGHLFALYDENKNFVNTGAHEASSATVVYTFTTPSNVAYIRFNGNMSSVDSTMFNEGSTALPYEPYWK